jgi:transcriptional repressor NrdR
LIRASADPVPASRRSCDLEGRPTEQIGEDGVGERTGSVGRVRCPACSSPDDKVVDSRTAEDGSAIRRRRQCLSCGRRFTTFERIEEVPLRVVKRNGDRVPFDRQKIVAGLQAAAKNRPVSSDEMEAVAVDVEDRLRLDGGGDVPTERIGLAVLERLRELDEVAYLRFASVYKQFDEAADFEREATLLTKRTQPKRR